MFALVHNTRWMGSIADPTPKGRLRAARKRAGLSQQELAARIGMAQSVISDAETQHPPKMLASTPAAICEQLGISADYVMGRAEADHHLDIEAEAAELLRQADPEQQQLAMRALRAMLAAPEGPSRKRLANGR